MTNIVQLVIYPDIRLKTRSIKVENFDDSLRHNLNNMLLATKAFDGIGIAGVQIGDMRRILYINHDLIISHSNKENNTKIELINAPLFMINPVILQFSDEIFISKEGCLSLPGIEANVSRAKYVRVEYQNEWGDIKVIETEVPLLSACIQHEINHIDGITIAEHQSRLKRDILIKKIRKFIQTENPQISIDLDKVCGSDCMDAHHHVDSDEKL